MTRRRRTAAAAVAVTAAGAVLTGCSLSIQSVPLDGWIGGDPMPVTVKLDNAEGMVMGADVRSGQELIGRVVDIRLEPGNAALELSIDSNADLPANTVASIELPSALGTPFLRLRAPEHPEGRLTEGAVIDMPDDEIGPQLESTLAAMGQLLTGSGMSQLESVISSLNTAFATEGRSAQVADLIDTANRLLSKTSRFTEDFNAAMAAAADVSEMLNNQRAAVDAFLTQVPAAVDVLAGQRDQIASLMTQAVNLAETMNSITDGRQGTLNELVPDASVVIDALATFNDQVGQTIGHMNEFLTNADDAIRGDYLAFDGALDIPGGIDKIITGGALLSGQPFPELDDLRDYLTGGLVSAPRQAAADTANPETGERADADGPAESTPDADTADTDTASADENEEGGR